MGPQMTLPAPRAQASFLTAIQMLLYDLLNRARVTQAFEAFVEQSPITMLLCGESVKPGEPGLFAMPPEDGSFCDREVHD